MVQSVEVKDKATNTVMLEENFHFVCVIKKLWAGSGEKKILWRCHPAELSGPWSLMAHDGQLFVLLKFRCILLQLYLHKWVINQI